MQKSLPPWRETKSVVSNWPLPKIAESAGSGSHRRPSQSLTPGKGEGALQPLETRQKAAFSPAQKAPEEWHQLDDELHRSAVLVRFPCGQNNVSVQKLCASAFPDADTASYRIKRKKGSDNTLLLFNSKSAFVTAHSGKGFKSAHHHPHSVHGRYSSSACCRQEESESYVLLTGFQGSRCHFFKMVFERGAHVFKVHEKAALLGVSADELDQLVATASAPKVSVVV